MFKYFFKILLAVLVITSLTFCKSKKELVKSDGCQTMATVKDFTGLDGCGLLVVLDNGDKLLPVNIEDDNFQLRDLQRIKLDYEVIEDAVSICMAEKASIKITCIELVEGRPVAPECYDTRDPMQVPWMKEVVNTQHPISIQKYKFRTDGWAYLFFVDNKQLLYDCQGTLLCEDEGLKSEACKNKYVPAQKGAVIWRAEEKSDR